MQINEHHLAVTKTARYCLLGELSPRTRDIWIVCHGFGQLAKEFITAFEPIVQEDRVIVAPEALSRFYKSQGTVHNAQTPVGATWMTSEDRENEIADYVRYLDTLLSNLLRTASPEANVTVLGFSQGTATVSRWVARSKPSVVRVILWGGLLPPELRDPEKVGGLTNQPLEFVVGEADRYFSSEMVDDESLAMKACGIPVTLSRFNGAHVLDSQTLRKIANQA